MTKPVSRAGPRLLTVLAVDDEAPALDELAYLLYRHPDIAEVIRAGDATSALRELNARRIDAVFLDINMPGMNGLEVLREIKACAVMQQIPVIMLTSSSADRDLDAAYRIGANSYVVKPMSLSGLQEAALKIEGFWLSLATPPPRRSTVRKYDPR